MSSLSDGDLALALQLQFQLESESAHDEVAALVPPQFASPSPGKDKASQHSIISSELETVDPTPDLHALFRQFDREFFWSKLGMCEVRWSPRMTSCAGVCSYQRRAGFCSIRLSVPLLKLRPRSDLVETLLHEMIHAFLFVTDGNDDRDGHGPAFHQHMHRINKKAGTKISVYHSFHDEVASYQTHWWLCSGPCRQRQPYFGLVKRAMNRAPGPSDSWFAQHQASCGGTFVKIKEPEEYTKKKEAAAARKRKLEESKVDHKQRDIRGFASTTKNDDKEDKKKGQAVTMTAVTTTAFAGRDAQRDMREFFASRYNSGDKENRNSKNPFDRETAGTGDGSDKNKYRGVSGKDDKSGSKSKRLDFNAASDAKSKSVNKNAITSKGSKKKSADKNPTHDRDTASSSSESAVCPVCSTSVAAAFINSHLDECLTKSALAEEQGRSDCAACPECRREVYKEEMDFHRQMCGRKK